MGLEGNKAIVRRHFQLISEGDASGAASLFAPRSRNHGRDVSREDILRTMTALVDQEEKFALHEVVGEEDWVACRATVSGRHNSKPQYLDGGIHRLVAPEGQPFTFQHLHLFRIVDDQIVEHRANRDDLGAARQLGLELRPAGE